MPQVVQPGVRQRCLGRGVRLVVRGDELGHQRGHGVGVDGLAPAGREHVAVPDAAPGVARVELVGGLVGLVLSQDGDGLVVDGDDAGPAALGGPVDPFAAR